MVVALKESPFESEMAIAPPLACGMTPLNTAVSSTREPLWMLSTVTSDGAPQLRVLQLVLEDMALIARVGQVPGLGFGDEGRFVTGVGGNHKVVWLTAFTSLGGNAFSEGRLYDTDPRNFMVRRSVATPSVQSDRNRPLFVAGDDHTVWVYNASSQPDYHVYKLSASTFDIQQRFALNQTSSLTGDRHGFWAQRFDTTYPSGQQVRLVYFTAEFIKEVDVVMPLWELGPQGPNRKVLGLVATGGKDAETGRDRALLFQTHRDDEGGRIQLVETESFAVLRSTMEQRGQYGNLRIGR